MSTASWLDICINNKDNERKIKRKLRWNTAKKIIIIPSHNCMSDLEKKTKWYSAINYTDFANIEITRRKNIGITSNKILCPEAEKPNYNESSEKIYSIEHNYHKYI